jgi:hypothetical protein
VQIVIAGMFFGTAFIALGQKVSDGELRGHVVDVSGAVIPNARIYLHRVGPFEEDIRLAAKADNQGDFKLDLSEGGYDVLVSSPGFSSKFVEVSVLSRKTRRLEIKLAPLGCDIPGMNCDRF